MSERNTIREEIERHALREEIERLRAALEVAQQERDVARTAAESLRGSLHAFRFPLPFMALSFPWERGQ